MTNILKTKLDKLECARRFYNLSSRVPDNGESILGFNNEGLPAIKRDALIGAIYFRVEVPIFKAFYLSFDAFGMFSDHMRALEESGTVEFIDSPRNVEMAGIGAPSNAFSK